MFFQKSNDLLNIAVGSANRSMFFQKSNGLLKIAVDSANRSMFFQKSNDLLNIVVDSVNHSMFFQKSNDLLNIAVDSVNRSMFFQKSNDLLNITAYPANQPPIRPVLLTFPSNSYTICKDRRRRREVSRKIATESNLPWAGSRCGIEDGRITLHQLRPESL